MSRDNRAVTYLTDEEERQFEEFLYGLDKGKAEVLRTALLEYIDRDKATRIEEKIDELTERVEALDGVTPTESDSATTHTHTASSGSGGASKTVQRAREIAQRIYDNHDAVVKDVDVKRAIEDVAGGDPRTMRKYKGMLRERGLLYEHPSDSGVWTPESERWAKWSVSYVDSVPSAEIPQICEDYPHGADCELFDEYETDENTAKA